MATQEWKATKRKGKKARQEGKVRKENKTANDGWMFLEDRRAKNYQTKNPDHNKAKINTPPTSKYQSKKVSTRTTTINNKRHNNVSKKGFL
jgi:hypothetical protein